MEPRTRAYLRGRFRDHYRRVAPSVPPAANEREWGFIPWSEGGTTMVRHRSMLDLGDLGDFLARKRPRHVYFSAGRYRDPGAGTMNEKGWREADLVFDLDADHLPGVDPEADSYAEMLATCKDALFRLLDFLEDDFGFEDLSIVFSGARGYHVHVRDEGVRTLGREARREIVDYVRGVGVDFERVVESEPVAGMGRETPAHKRSLSTEG
ncbi:MAG: DNA primase small subunit domain-containing protein, partial [archaeon]